MEGLGQVQRQKSRQHDGATREEAALRDKWHRHSCLPRGTTGLCAVHEAWDSPASTPVASLPRDFHLASGSRTAPELTRRPSVVEMVLDRVAQVKRTGRSACATEGQGFLIHGGAIKTPRKAFNFSNLKISKSAVNGG